jgi:hypothetical protein
MKQPMMNDEEFATMMRKRKIEFKGPKSEILDYMNKTYPLKSTRPMEIAAGDRWIIDDNLTYEKQLENNTRNIVFLFFLEYASIKKSSENEVTETWDVAREYMPTISLMLQSVIVEIV